MRGMAPRSRAPKRRVSDTPPGMAADDYVPRAEYASDRNTLSYIAIVFVVIGVALAVGAAVFVYTKPPAEDGASGARGPRGYNGTDGFNGTQGPRGFNGTCTGMCYNGAQGPRGFNGTDGVCSAPCVNGTQGPRGFNGTIGPQGPAGSDAPHGILVEAYLTIPAVTPIGVADTWYKVLGTTVNSVVHPNVSHSDNRLTYIGTEPIIVHAFASFSVDVDTAGSVYSTGAAKNGAIITSSVLENKMGGSDVASTALHFMCTLEENDYVEIHVLQQGGAGGDPLFTKMNMGFLGMPNSIYGTVP